MTLHNIHAQTTLQNCNILFVDRYSAVAVDDGAQFPYLTLFNIYPQSSLVKRIIVVVDIYCAPVVSRQEDISTFDTTRYLRT